jgi:acyl carrier protein
VIKDLGLDSLSLAELVVSLIDEYDMYSLAKTLDERSWEDVTVGALYDEFLTGLPPRSPSSRTA